MLRLGIILAMRGEVCGMLEKLFCVVVGGSSVMEARNSEGHPWCLWQNRNDKVWKGHAINALQIDQQSFNSWKAWLEAREMQQNSSNLSLVQQ
ncbi:hypothetical protein A2U01_0044580 [Trifolium medium]|uniref:Uncharacterized protein n=1 Tax=Trifolium medium TaxID=97028 RepID=A0A392QG64_9FABA|nr:hypothetical protein [Trifolium medium]